jgi:hypothetical protein
MSSSPGRSSCRSAVDRDIVTIDLEELAHDPDEQQVPVVAQELLDDNVQRDLSLEHALGIRHSHSSARSDRCSAGVQSTTTTPCWKIHPTLPAVVAATRDVEQLVTSDFIEQVAIIHIELPIVTMNLPITEPGVHIDAIGRCCGCRSSKLSRSSWSCCCGRVSRSRSRVVVVKSVVVVLIVVVSALSS